MIIGNKEFDLENSAYICGILNVTPDSFSDGGKYNNIDAALYHVDQMIRDGATIIDVGGESTRPGYTMISDEEEISRVVPVIRAIKDRFDITVSLDTYKHNVAKCGLEAGVDLINDIWGIMYDDEMAKVIAKYNCACCLMHNRKDTAYNDFFTDYIDDCKKIIAKAEAYNIKADRIILDPGVGFAKDYKQNLMVIDKLDELCRLGYPVLLGTSRKSVIGLALDLPKDERVEGTVATTVYGLTKGARIFRVHDVLENFRALKMTCEIMGIQINK